MHHRCSGGISKGGSIGSFGNVAQAEGGGTNAPCIGKWRHAPGRHNGDDSISSPAGCRQFCGKEELLGVQLSSRKQGDKSHKQELVDFIHIG